MKLIKIRKEDGSTMAYVNPDKVTLLEQIGADAKIHVEGGSTITLLNTKISHVADILGGY